MPTTPTPKPTQVRRPWRATVRTIVQGILAGCLLLPFLVQETHLDPKVYPWLGGLLAVAAAITRVMALPQVEAFLRRFVPWLAADPGPSGARRNDTGAVDALYLATLVLVVLVIVVIVLLAGVLHL